MTGQVGELNGTTYVNQRRLRVSVKLGGYDDAKSVHASFESKEEVRVTVG